MDDIIYIKNLVKSYGEVKAVQDISFRVKRGELFAFLGVNGAGKSTTISIICGLLEMDSGLVMIDGKSLDENTESIRRNLGVVFQNSVLDKVLTVYDNLKVRAALYGITGEAFTKRLSEIDEMLDIKELYKREVMKLSGGQRRRVDIARALLHEPKILILDEPTTGLDPQTRATVWKVIETLRKNKDMTVLLTTHYMEEAADANYVVIMDDGTVVAEGTPIDLKNKYTGDFITIYNAAENDIKKFNLPYEKRDKAFRIAVSQTSEATRLIKEYPEIFIDYEVTKGKMDDVFLAATGKKLLEGTK